SLRDLARPVPTSLSLHDALPISGYGRVSRFGLVAFGSSLDCISTFGATVNDAARLLAVIAGHDPRDATTHDAPAIGMATPMDLRDRKSTRLNSSHVKNSFAVFGL